MSEKELLKLQAEGWDSDMIRMRLAYAGADSSLKYLKPILGKHRVHPRFLVTQASGRWSTTNPPLVNWSAGCISPACSTEGWHVAKSTPDCWSLRDIVVPDKGTYFLKRDWDAIEAKLAAAYSRDDRDLGLFAEGLDIHTVTCCDMFQLPEPPNLRDPHRSHDCHAWREEVGWGGKDDWRRVASKTARYSLAYGTDETALLQATGITDLAAMMGIPVRETVKIGKAYLDAKPQLVAFKQKVWQQIIDTQEARTALGRRRRLFVTPEEREKWRRFRRPGPACREGLNHIFQGWVADAQNLSLIAIKKQWPAMRLAYQTHDGDVWVIPEELEVWPAIRPLVEREWTVGDRSFISTATWSKVHHDGHKEELG